MWVRENYWFNFDVLKYFCNNWRFKSRTVFIIIMMFEKFLLLFLKMVVQNSSWSSYFSTTNSDQSRVWKRNMLSTTSLLTAVCPLTRVRSIPFSPSFWVDSNPVVQPINCEFSTLWSPPPLLLPKDFVPFFPLLLRFHELCNNVPLGKRKKRRKGNGLQTCSESSKRKSVLYCGYPKSSSSATKKWNCIYVG